MFFLFRSKDKNRFIEKREKSFSQMLPYTYHYNANTILTKNNEMISVIKIEGFAFQTADDEDVDNKKIDIETKTSLRKIIYRKVEEIDKKFEFIKLAWKNA